jgi:hypothetical protein
MKVTHPYSPWRSLTEASIRELKKSVRQTLRRTQSPARLWSLCTAWCAAIRQLTSCSIPQLYGRTSTEFVEGSTPDISAYSMFDWYQPVFYYSPTAQFPAQRKAIGRWIGVAQNSTDEMSYLILAKIGRIVIQKSVWGISANDLALPLIRRQIGITRRIHR